MSYTNFIDIDEIEKKKNKNEALKLKRKSLLINKNKTKQTIRTCKKNVKTINPLIKFFVR